MDGSPQVVRFDVTTLWHSDAAESAPSTASIAVIAPRRRPCPLLFAGPAAPDRGSQRGRNDCASSCLTSAARDGGTGAASASYWSLNERPIAASPTCRSAAGALLGVAQVTICRRIQ